MNKFLMFFLIMMSYAFSQKKGIAYYGYTEFGATNKGVSLDYNSYLLFNKELSYYVTCKDSLEKDEKKYKSQSVKSAKGGSFSSGMKVSAQGDQVFTSLSKKTMWSNLYRIEMVYVNEPIAKQEWKITNENRKFGKFTCRKATTTFRGRDYTAWFTPEIAVPFGPWKFNGLPGLILEVYDTNKDFYWFFKSVEYPTEYKEEITFIKKSKGDKAINFLDLKELEQFKIKQREIQLDKNQILAKKFQGVYFQDQELSDMFVEF
jgi:GLPGLI family protein